MSEAATAFRQESVRPGVFGRRIQSGTLSNVANVTLSLTRQVATNMLEMARLVVLQLLPSAASDFTFAVVDASLT